MDQKGDHDYYYNFIIKTLQFLVPLSIFSFLFSYFAGFPILILFDNLRFSSLISPLFAQAPDRKFMFLICIGILAFLTNNLKLSSSSLSYGGFVKNINADEDVAKQIPEFATSVDHDYVDNDSPINVAVSEEKAIVELQEDEQDYEAFDNEYEETNDCTDCQFVSEEKRIIELQQQYEEIFENGGSILESGDWEDEDDEDEDELDQNGVLESISVNDVRVSTEELNKKFEEFIRRMKEEIRIEARRQLIAI